MSSARRKARRAEARKATGIPAASLVTKQPDQLLQRVQNSAETAEKQAEMLNKLMEEITSRPTPTSVPSSAPASQLNLAEDIEDKEIRQKVETLRELIKCVDINANRINSNVSYFMTLASCHTGRLFLSETKKVCDQVTAATLNVIPESDNTPAVLYFARAQNFDLIERFCDRLSKESINAISTQPGSCGDSSLTYVALFSPEFFHLHPRFSKMVTEEGFNTMSQACEESKGVTPVTILTRSKLALLKNNYDLIAKINAVGLNSIWYDTDGEISAVYNLMCCPHGRDILRHNPRLRKLISVKTFNYVITCGQNRGDSAARRLRTEGLDLLADCPDLRALFNSSNRYLLYSVVNTVKQEQQPKASNSQSAVKKVG